ncbi:uncharacterized protein LOC132062766 [Lycium ferocissimum]|uniref:uncharacterized protein LOC132062766 n=1 Tax=Lycium ferocissimum TaxID=112874 RepID=UPI002816643C|nr:uncharacterized protein LOC132062766 [Lycium ferocissimum]
MGACASAPKDIKADAAAAPLPEQPKEEETTTTTVTTEVTTVDKQVNGEDGEKKVDDEKVSGDIDNSNSLGSLLTENEAAKESVKDEKSSETTHKKPEAAQVVSDETDAKQPAGEKKINID